MKHITKKYIQIGVIVITAIHSLIYILVTTLGNPLNNEDAKVIILTAFSLYFFIMTGYWIFCILNLLLSHTSRRIIGLSFLLGMILFFAVPLYLKQGLLCPTGMCLIVANIIAWCIYFTRKKSFGFLILSSGFVIILLTFPYCSILWD